MNNAMDKVGDGLSLQAGLEAFFENAVLLIAALALLLLAKLVLDLTTSYSLDHELTQADNPAVAASVLGYLGGTAAILVGSVLGPSSGLWADVADMLGYGALGIGLLTVSRFINDRFLLGAFSNAQQLAEHRNVGAGAVEAGSYLASGLLVAGAIHGEGGGVLSACVFFALGQVALVAFARMYARALPYDVHGELLAGNSAVGMSYAGMLVGLGLMLMHGADGDFTSFGVHGVRFALESGLGVLLLPLVRRGFDRLWVPKADLGKEIAQDRNVGLGLLEGAFAVVFAVLWLSSIDFEPLSQSLWQQAALWMGVVG